MKQGLARIRRLPLHRRFVRASVDESYFNYDQVVVGKVIMVDFDHFCGADVAEHFEHGNCTVSNPIRNPS